MIDEGQLKMAVFGAVQQVTGDLVEEARFIFREEKVQRAMADGDVQMLIEALAWAIRRWVPSRQKLMLLAGSGALGEAALLEYKNLKIKLLEGVNDENS